MAESRLDQDLARERSVAVRRLLAAPLLDASDDPDAFRLVARHASWLTEYFEETCGWALTVDGAAGFARLAKRAAVLDDTRPLRRSRGEKAPFDRRRYQLLCLVCAELVRHPVTTVGLLAAAVAGDASLDTSRHGERTAFVDALRALIGWGVLEATAGDVDAFMDSAQANALLTADTARLHRLLVSPAAPSSLLADLDCAGAVDRLLDEPRYGTRAEDGEVDESDESRNRWARHRLGRRVLDDPVVHTAELEPAEAAYLASISGRRWIRERIEEAGFELEERSDGLLAVDPDGIATDMQFPAAMGNAHQLALLLVDRLVTEGPDGERVLGRLTPGQLKQEVDAVLARFPAWARGQRDEGGPERLARDAADLLAAFGLVRREDDGTVCAGPALARYRAGEPIVHRAASLFDDGTAEEPALEGAGP
ncbi:MAG TPA: TIGR02678 family protein [Acidimicrobiales bacterium]|nr:TIGR02678 family protein [Acidimicrobiales bacterium]